MRASALGGLLVAALGTFDATAQTPADPPHARGTLVAATTHARPGEPLTVALHLSHDREWHTYWKNPGDAGMPTRLAWSLPPGVTAGPIDWPAPKRLPTGPLTSFGYDGDVLLLTMVTVPKDWPAGTPLPLRARADWLVCKEVCLPGGTDLALDVPVSQAPTTPDPQWGPRIAATRGALPRALSGWVVTAQAVGSDIELQLVPSTRDDRTAAGVDALPSRRWPTDLPPATMWFFPDSPELIDHPAPQRVERAPDGALVLRVAASPLLTVAPARVSGVLVAEPNSDATGVARDNLGPVTIDAAWSGAAPAPRATGEDSTGSAAMNAADIRAAAGLDAAAGTAAGADLGLLAALGLAFVGGLILNLMPCVFPVVSIKVLGFVQDAGASRARARANGFAFAAGVVVSFWALAGALLALRASGEALGWGWQLQSPPVVAGLAALFFVLGLNLSGVFEMGARVQALAGRAPAGNGLGGAFASGLLATAVATPCTAPLMGAALGWALTQPALAAMAVFTALALGMAAPYVLLASLPALAAKLPRPGRWMETLKQFLAFPLYLTVVWLVWVLAEQMGAGAAARLLAGLVLIAAGLWAWQRFGVAGNARGFALGAAAAFVAAAVFVGWPQGEPQAATRTASKDWGVWSVAQVDALRAQKRAVFVDFTAAWCVSCQVNKRVVLDTDAVRGAFERAGVERLRADWTQRDPAITAALAALGRSGVPVYVVWPADGGAPEVLPEVLTRDLVLGAIARATQGTTPRTDAAALPRDGGDATRAN